MSEEIESQQTETLGMAELSDGKKFLAGGGGALAGIFIDTAMMHHNGVGGLIFGTALGAMTAFGYPILRPVVDSVAREFNTLAGKRQALIAARLEQTHETHFNSETEPLPVTTTILEATTQEAAQMQLGPDALPPIFPLHPVKETLELGRAADTGQKFAPHVNDFISQGLIVAAMQGWGKSQLVGRIVEQCGKCGMMVVLFDHKGEHETITDLPYLKGLRAGADPSAGFQLTAENADEFVQLVMEQRHQAIINLPSYGLKWIERATIVSAVGRALMNYAEEKRRKRQRVMPCLVLLDEAQLYIPQDPTFLPPEAQSNKEIQGELKNSFFALATNGRSAGYTVGFATQSLTFITKALIKSCAIQVLGRHVEKNALDMCEDIIDDDDIATRAEVKSFPKGKGVIFGFTKEPMVVQFDKKESLDLAETPTIEWLREPELTATRKQEPDVQDTPSISGGLTIDTILALYAADKLSEEAMLKLIDRLPSVHQDDDHFEEDSATGNLAPEIIDFQSRNARHATPASVQQREQPRQQHAKYQKALAAWNEGHQSVRTLALALDITESAAYKLMTDMDKLGLIQMKRKAK
jgi:hypothetical protein